MEGGSRGGEAGAELEGRQGGRKGSGQPMNAREKWQITIVIKMAIWMIKGSLGLLRSRRRRERVGARKERMEGACSK